MSSLCVLEKHEFMRLFGYLKNLGYESSFNFTSLRKSTKVTEMEVNIWDKTYLKLLLNKSKDAV